MRDIHLLKAAATTPWAIDEKKGRVLLAVLDAHIRGIDRVSARGAREESAQRVAVRRDVAATTPSTIGVIPIHGVLMPRGEFLSDGSGSTSLEGARALFKAMMESTAISGVVLDIDSPGGQVFSVPEFAAEIRAAAKPVVAQVWDYAASAAYWLASAAQELVVSPSGMVGSIGVYSIHEDWSRAYEEHGIKLTAIQAGKYKTELADFQPLSEEAQAYEQTIVDGYYTMFVRDVARGRKVGVDEVRGGFGEGRVVLAEDAVRRGMADRVGTFDDTVARLVRDIRKRERERAQSQQLKAARRRAETWV